MNIKTIALTVMSLAVFASCSQKQAKETPAPKVEVKTVKPECLLGKSIDKLVKEGTLEFGTQETVKFTLTNKLFANINFPEVGINYYKNEDDKVRNICYAYMIPNQDINAKYAQIKTYMQGKYGEPTKESRSYSKDGVARYTNTLWDNDFYAIALSMTEPLQEERGSIIVIFTNSEGTQAFSTFFQ